MPFTSPCVFHLVTVDTTNPDVREAKGGDSVEIGGVVAWLLSMLTG